MTSRETSEAFMPSVPMVIPSDITMVLHSIGVPPAARIAFLHLFRERAQMKIARRHVAPGVRHGDQRPREVGIREARGLQHRAGRCPRDSFFYCVTLHLELTFRAFPKTKSPATCLQVRGAFA